MPPQVQTALLKQLVAANPKTILVMITGGPSSINWEAANLPAIMVMWYGGQQGGRAVADALAGVVSPAGRLPTTWPTGLSQLPPELVMSPAAPPGRTCAKTRDRCHIMIIMNAAVRRRFLRTQNRLWAFSDRYLSQTPLYSFGFGLTYGAPMYSALTLAPSARLPAAAAARLTVRS